LFAVAVRAYAGGKSKRLGASNLATLRKNVERVFKTKGFELLYFPDDRDVNMRQEVKDDDTLEAYLSLGLSPLPSLRVYEGEIPPAENPGDSDEAASQTTQSSAQSRANTVR
jgi:hypothetical protein